jgi:DNA-binding response OmpR family regulator/tRNA A-37 threonylcarbamoyl transferase component Bud32
MRRALIARGSMSIKVLVIDDDPAFRALFRHHITTEWPDAAITEHDPLTAGKLAPEFTAAGYDVVLLDHTLGAESGLDWMKELSSRPGFPPILYLGPSGEDADVLPALRAGAEACISKVKVDHRRFIGTLSEAARKRKRQLALTRGTQQSQQAYRFGGVTIRGQRFIRAISTGSIASVYLAESERAGAIVVLKVLRKVPDQDEAHGTFDRFLQEYEVVSKVDHPNVVRIYDLGVADDHAYIAMEYFPAGDLRERMRKKIEPEQAVEYLRQMAAALQAIHAVGVLHRDLKPGNVMLRNDGSLALIDFGLAKQLKLDMEITATGEIFGTPYYMSPEQGHGAEVDERSDIYSLGVIFYEMLTGKKPYLASTPMAVIYKHSHAPLPELAPEIAHLETLTHRLLGKEPRDRYQSATQLLDAIEALDHSPLRAAAGE